MSSPSDTIVVLGQPRTGTHLLLSMLQANGYGYVGELFADTCYLKSLQTNSGPGAIRRRLDESRSNGTVALSVMANHFDEACGHLGIHGGRAIALETVFAPCVYVATRREDIVAQAVSFVCSKRSGRFHSHQKARRPLPPYDENRIAKEIVLLRSLSMTWGDVPLLLGASEVTYELLVNDPVAAMERLGHATGYRFAVTQQTRFRKVAGRVEAEYIEAFKASASAARLLDVIL